MALVLVDSWEQCQLAKSLAVNDDCLVTSWSLSSVTSHQHHHPRLTGRYSRTTQVLDFNAARDAASGLVQVVTPRRAKLHHAPPLENQHLLLLQARYPSCRPTNTVNILKGKLTTQPTGRFFTHRWPNSYHRNDSFEAQRQIFAHFHIHNSNSSA